MMYRIISAAALILSLFLVQSCSHDKPKQKSGDIIVQPDAPPAVADQFAAHVIWLDEVHLLPGRTYTLRLGTQKANKVAEETLAVVKKAMKQDYFSRVMSLS